MSEEPARRRATIYDVARAANVSHQTVARLVGGASNINDEMRVRITTAIDELHYLPNLRARDLARHRNRLLGAIVSYTSELGPNREVQGAILAAREAGYTLDVVNIDRNNADSYREALQQFEAKDVAGVLVQASTDELLSAAESQHSLVPVYIEHADERDDTNFTQVDAHGTSLLVDHLFDQGHRRFYYIGGPGNWVSARLRSQGFRVALAKHELEPIGESQGDWSARSGYDSVTNLADVLEFSALVAGNDQMALGALRALADKGIHVPDQVSVAGFDNLPDSEFYNPPLTTVAQDSDRQGRLAISRLLDTVEGRPATAAEAIRAQLVVRTSTAEAAV